tara:strand:+ start:142 stop:390 length:249 start_codon:yes stop_codon:yes gene_type:complete
MWTDKEVTISGKKYDVKVNQTNKMIEIEMMFDLKLKNVNTITLDSKDYKVLHSDNVGNRDETLRLTVEVNNNGKSSKGRKTS